MNNLKYLWVIIKHKWFVLVAGLKVGGIPLLQLIVHDWSKFTPIEFVTYRKTYFDKTMSDDDLDRTGWKHHIEHNPHHFDHWIKDGVPQPMPYVYVREMLADWMAAGRAYKGYWDIQPWIINDFWPRKKQFLHPETIQILRSVLKEQNLELPE